MALSMHEQQLLAEMERRLVAEDPMLASRLTSFGHPRVAAVLRSRRARLALCLLMLVALALVSLAVYVLSPLRGDLGNAAGQGPGVSSRVTQQAP